MKITSLAFLVLAGCASVKSSAPPATSPKQAVASASLVLDVRTPEEFAEGHLASAENIPVTDLEARLAEVSEKVGNDKSRPIAVYCAAGRRAGKAKAILEAAGFSNVTNAGGYEDLR